ncbi:hypothetical protein SmJEL517_g01981 [Synchytrium microbalum]|uniref:Trafficking protein particle complex subunit n=1 Tax=Synchytrium microbalum TaxID=1806994 RepID=A0A507C489_9FUNG|nr:uncharacterized protein SmJEL517_g01981 [Synchytrium microbalum]TPX35787.1 hypothetical protein SmJEL517_g01981 [Synchytrium microbalum]
MAQAAGRLSMASTGSSLSRRPPILERNLGKGKAGEISLSAYAFLFSEMMQYTQKRVNGIQDFEKKLSDFGYRVGVRVLELTVWRERNARRETRVLGVLSFIHSNIWKTLFGKQADALEKSTEQEDEYMISDNEPPISKFIAIPKEMSQLNASAFVAGIVEGILDGCGFPSRVSAHSTATDAFPLRTTILIKFDPTVIARERTFTA